MPNERPLSQRPQGQRSVPPDRPSRVRFLLLNPHDTSGWIAYDDGESADTEMYRVVVVRESTGELLYDGRAPLSVNLRESGFEMDEGDPRFQELIQAADRHFVTPLLQMAPAPPQPESTPARPTSAPVPRRPTQQPRQLEASRQPEAAAPVAPQQSFDEITLIEQTDDIVILHLGEKKGVTVGQRLFMRTPPEILINPATQEETILSRGRISALLEVISVEDNRAQARLLDGDVPEEGYFELVD
ncbi:MAG: hypothetical protein LAT83_03130 [Kiritimatiellae bacterium]|nr:hypothetical protein [Kiritimatiellia bacterium]